MLYGEGGSTRFGQRHPWSGTSRRSSGSGVLGFGFLMYGKGSGEVKSCGVLSAYTSARKYPVKTRYFLSTLNPQPGVSRSKTPRAGRLGVVKRLRVSGLGEESMLIAGGVEDAAVPRRARI